MNIVKGVSNDIRRASDLAVALNHKGTPMFNQPVSSNTLTSQAVYGQAVYLYAGEVVTNILTNTQTAGTSTVPTSIKVSIWSDAAGTPTCRAVSAELNASSNWTSQGWKESACAYTVPTSGIYYLAIWENGAFAGTALALAVNTSAGPPGTPAGSAARIYGTLKTGAASVAVNDTGTYAQAGTVPLLDWN